MLNAPNAFTVNISVASSPRVVFPDTVRLSPNAESPDIVIPFDTFKPLLNVDVPPITSMPFKKHA